MTYKVYIIIHTAWLTPDRQQCLANCNIHPTHIVDDEGDPTEYLILKVDLNAAITNEFRGYRKLTTDQARIVISSIVDGTIEVSEYYHQMT